MSSSVKCLGNLNLTGSQACGKVRCEVDGTQGLIPSQLSPNHGHVLVSSLGWLRVDGVGEGKMERGKRAKTVENVEIS